MNCEEMSMRMSAYLDKELLSGEAKEVEEHLMSCSECRRQFSEFSHIEMLRPLVAPGEVTEEKWLYCWESIKEKAAISFGGGYKAKELTGRSRIEARARLVRFALYTSVAVAAACVLLVLGSYLLTAPSPEPVQAQGASVVINDYDDVRYTLFVEDNPDFVMIRLTPVNESPGGG